MSSFIYFTPTKVVFEADAEKKAGALLLENNAKKVLVHYGSDRVIESGLLGTVIKSIEEAGISYVTLGGVVPNPRISKVYEGIELCRENDVDFILAVGGGSVIDSAKAIAIGVVYDGDVWDFFEKKADPKAALPLGTVLTIPAAGSEMSTGMVITKEEGGLKRDTGGDFCMAKFSLLNPMLTLTLPKEQTVNGAVDIMMHTMERYFHKNSDMEITDAIAQGLLRSVMESAKILCENPADVSARESIMWAGSLAHNGLTGCGSGGGDWSTHQIEHEISGLFDVAHGAGLSTVWASWARYVIEQIPHRFAKFATEVMGVSPCENEMETGLLGIKAMEDFYHCIGSPTNFVELLGREVTADEIEIMANSVSDGGTRTFGAAKTLAKADVVAIYSNIK